MKWWRRRWARDPARSGGGLEIYLQRVTDPDAAVALSILLVAVAALVVLLLGVRGLTGTAPG
jgi:hypothetical protein